MQRIFIFMALIFVFTKIAAQTGKVGVNTTTPTETLDINGTERIKGLPVDGTANAIYTRPDGSASPAKDQAFNATKTVVADSNGVLGVINGLPATSGTVKKCLRSTIGEAGFYETDSIPFIITLPSGNTYGYEFVVIDKRAGILQLLMRHNNVLDERASSRQMYGDGSSVKDFTLTRAFQKVADVSFQVSFGTGGYIILHSPITSTTEGGITFDYRIATLNQNGRKFVNICIEGTY